MKGCALMIIRKPSYMLISANSHRGRYQEQDFYPEWALLSGIVHGQLATGQGVEPHYHDCDEFWIFNTGRGEVRLDGQSYAFISNTVVYMALGLIHQFQCYAPGAAAGLILRAEGQGRVGHLTVEEFGLPERTVSGFVIEGRNNTGPFAERGPRCPLSELRMVTWTAKTPPQVLQLQMNEYWYVTDGVFKLTIEGVSYTLVQDDVAILKGGVTREVQALDDVRLILAHE
jgi:mannose-6-phosphate isomerase-like protein (cupin superfamily)